MLFITTLYVVGNVRMKYGASLILTRESRNTLRRAYPSTTFSTRFSTRIVLISNSTSAARDWRPTALTRSPRSMTGDWAPGPRQGLPSYHYNNKRLIQWLNHILVRCYKLKFLKCVMSPRSKSVFSTNVRVYITKRNPDCLNGLHDDVYCWNSPSCIRVYTLFR